MKITSQNIARSIENRSDDADQGDTINKSADALYNSSPNTFTNSAFNNVLLPQQNSGSPSSSFDYENELDSANPFSTVGIANIASDTYGSPVDLTGSTIEGTGQTDTQNSMNPPGRHDPLEVGDSLSTPSGSIYVVDEVSKRFGNYHYQITRYEIGDDGLAYPWETTIDGTKVGMTGELKVDGKTGRLEEGRIDVTVNGESIGGISIDEKDEGQAVLDKISSHFAVSQNMLSDLLFLYDSSRPETETDVDPEPEEHPDDIDIGPNQGQEGGTSGGHGASGGGGGGGSGGFGGFGGAGAGGGGAGGWGGTTGGGVEGTILENGPLSGDVEVVEPDYV